MISKVYQGTIAEMLLLSALGLLIVSTASFASEWTPVPIQGVEMKCFEESQPVQWSYCLNITSGSRSQDLIYYLHGRNGDTTWWNDASYYTGDVHRSWKDKKQDVPTVVSVSFGPLWLLTERGDQDPGGLYRVFLSHVLPTVEGKLGKGIGKRLLVGESMGGVNALMLGLKAGKTFSKVAALCPPLPTVSPQASWLEKYRYIRRGGVSWKNAFLMLVFSSRFFPDERTWLRNDPVEVSRGLDPSVAPALYLSCGRKDSWGCLEGSQRIVANVRARGGRIEWNERPGGHCDIDVESLGKFLLN